MMHRKLNLGRVLTFPNISYGEAKEFRLENRIPLSDLEYYTGINKRTISKIENGFAPSLAIMNLYLLSIERLMMLKQGYIPSYQKISEIKSQSTGPVS